MFRRVRQSKVFFLNWIQLHVGLVLPYKSELLKYLKISISIIIKCLNGFPNLWNFKILYQNYRRILVVFSCYFPCITAKYGKFILRRFVEASNANYNSTRIQIHKTKFSTERPSRFLLFRKIPCIDYNYEV